MPIFILLLLIFVGTLWYSEGGGTGLSSKGARNPVDWSSSFPKKGNIYDNLTTDGYATADDRPIFRESQLMSPRCGK